MHLKVLACEVLAREIYYCAARSLNTVDIELYTQGLHDNTDICRQEVQERVSGVEREKYASLLLGYGLCNNGMAGIKAGDVPVVIPRAHDCITFFLGSKERYKEHFYQHPGTYYYTSGWLEYQKRGGKRVSYEQKSGLSRQRSYEELVEKYGEDNAKYIVEVMSSWQTHYTDGVLIDFEFVVHLDLEEQVKRICEERGWLFSRLKGDLGLIQRWLDGEWGEDDFLIVEPGQMIAATYDDRIIEARPTISA